MNDEHAQNEIRFFWRLSQALLLGGDMELWEVIDELEVLEMRTKQPALKLRCAALIREHAVFLNEASGL